MEKKELARQDWKAGMKYSAIAEKHGVPLSTVKSWAARYWKSETIATNATGRRKVATQKTQPTKATPTLDQQLAAAVEENEELTPQQKDFCLYYTRTRNATQAYFKAFGCSYDSARAHGWELLQNVAVQAELRRLRDIKAAALGSLCGEDVVEMHMRIAFADMTDFATFNGDAVSVKSSDEIDGQLVSEVSEGQIGVKVKLADRQKSLAFLERYFELNPTDRQRAKYDKAIEDLRPLAELLKDDENAGNPMEAI